MVADYRLATLQGSPRDLIDGKRHQPVLCAEPSPDVARAFSSAIASSVTADLKSTTGQSANVSGAFQRQTAQAIAQLGKRYATVQILRDILHDQCRQYANGVLSESTWAILQSRFNSLVVTMLGMEMAAGEGSGDSGDASDTTAPDKPAEVASQPTVQQFTSAAAAVSGARDEFTHFNSSVHALSTAKAPGTSASAPSSGASAADPTKLATAKTKLEAARTSLKKSIDAMNKAWTAIAAANGKTDGDAKDAYDAFKKAIPADDDATLADAVTAAKAADTTRTRMAADLMTKTSADLKAVATKFAGLAPKPASIKPADDKPKPKPKPDGGGAANAIASMQHEYLQKEDIGPSLLACFTLLDPPGADRAVSIDVLQHDYCKKVFDARIREFDNDHDAGPKTHPRRTVGAARKPDPRDEGTPPEISLVDALLEKGQAGRLLLYKFKGPVLTDQQVNQLGFSPLPPASGVPPK